jgi:phage terminase small subunit
MAGMPGRSGGARPGAGRPRKTMVLTVPAAEPARVTGFEPGTPGAFLLAVAQDATADPKLRVDAAKALLPYCHAKVAEPSKAAQSDAQALAAHAGTGWQSLLN